MSIPVFLGLCGLGVPFLVYVLVQFWREGLRGNSEPAIVFGRSPNPNLIVVAHPLSLGTQGGISVMLRQPQVPVSANNSVTNRDRITGKARVLQMPLSGIRRARRESAGPNKPHNSLKVG